MTFQDFLDESVTYRTLALYLGIQNEWWEEFWRSFSFVPTNGSDEKLRSLSICCKGKDLPFLMSFLSNWFGKNAKIADIPEKEFGRAYRVVTMLGVWAE